MILANTLRHKLTEGKPTVGTHFLSREPDLAEIIGDLNVFDYAEFVAEYATFDMDLLYHMARAGQCANLPLMIKPDMANQEFWAQAAIGAGFKAVLFTDIRTVDDVWAAHRAIRPDTPADRGHLGVKLRRGALGDYGLDAYLEELRGIVFLIMIEKNVAVDSLDAILEAAKEAGVDMTQWGPSDFSFSRGTPELAGTPEIRQFEELVIKKSLDHGVPPRIEIGAVEQAQRYVDLGVRHFCIGWDRFIIQERMARLGEGMRKVVEGL